MEKLFTWIFSLVFLFSICVNQAVAEGGSLTNFSLKTHYTAGQFSDVSSQAWYTKSVQTVYELDLMRGTYNNKFNIDGNITLGEAVAIADRLHSIYYNDGVSFKQGTPWYQVYIDYAFHRNILTSGYTDYTKRATRGEFAKLLSASLPENALEVINTIEDDSIPDVNMSSSYAEAVYQLYRAGILTGNNSAGNFSPDSEITRASVATIVSRVADMDLRKSIMLTTPSTYLSAEQVYTKCSTAVAYIGVYNEAGTLLKSGSGFFIDRNGTMVTNYHVIENGYSAKVTTADDKVYTVTGIYDYDEGRDLALLKVSGSRFSYLQTDTSALNAGASIYTIGSPLGLSSTISTGIVSNPSRSLDGQEYIQITAPISSGSSGGALINTSGKVIGIISGALTSESGVSQNLNLAIPIHYIYDLSKASMVPLASFVSDGSNISESGGSVGDLTSSLPAITIYEGDSQSVTISELSGTNTDLTCISTNPKVAEASLGDWDGHIIPLVITGISPGTAILTVSYGQEPSCQVEIQVYVVSNCVYYIK